MCTPLMKYFGGGYTRWFGSMPGRQYGAWRNGELGLTFRLYAKEAWIGEYLSKYMSQHPMGSGWYRSA
jgi:hypothetical protein